jgi:transcriptional regulator with XRE-family HTH domain
MDKQEIAHQLGRNLFLLRRRAGLSQAELGQKTGIAQARISVFEHGEGLPQLDQFVRICQALDARPDQLLKGVTASG